MSYEAQLVYSVPLLRRAVVAYWKRSVGILLPVVLGFMTIDLAFLVVQGDRSWVVGALAIVVLLSGVFIATLYFIHYQNALRKLRDMGLPHARFLADEPTFTVESEIGSSTFRWSSIREVWRFPTFWLLLFSKAQFMTLPTAHVSSEMQAFVLGQIRAAGGKVVD